MTGPFAALLPARAIVMLSGPDRVSFLHGLITNDVHRLAPDRALYAGLLTPQGKLLWDFFLADEGERILIDIAAEKAADLVKRLKLYKLRAAVEISDPMPALAVAALWGRGAAAKLALPEAEGAAGAGALGLAFVDPRLAALGLRRIGTGDAFAFQQAFRERGFTIEDPRAYDLHRLALGIADTAEIGGEACYPLEANFEALHGVDFHKGCYVGQELTARMKHRGGLRKRVLPVRAGEPLPQAGSPIVSGDLEIGTLIASFGLQGLALLRLDRLADHPALTAQSMPIAVSWPAWLPR